MDKEMENEQKDNEKQSIDFAEWISANFWIQSSDDLWYWKSDGNPSEGITTSELYVKFQKEKNYGNNKIEL